MEILTENNVIVENNHKTIGEEAIKTVQEIIDFAKFNDYSFNNSQMPYDIWDGINSKVLKLSLNEVRKLKNAINNFRKKQTIRSANIFLHFVTNKVLNIPTIKLEYPAKQLAIIKSRKKYVELRKAMLEAQKTYKEEKGDYYKLRLAKGQKVS